jgi:predicted flavoprotein YhiN
MAGVKTTAEVTLFIDNKSNTKVTGDILFAAYGISGLAILDISQTGFSCSTNKQRVSIALNLLPRYDRGELVNIIEKLFASVPKHDVHTALCGLTPR